jgi:hypothetical protein
MPPYSVKEWERMSDPAQEQPENVITRARRTTKYRLMKLAMVIEPDTRRLSDWWTQVPIIELGSRTADELVVQGLENLVEKFLLTIIFGDRD